MEVSEVLILGKVEGGGQQRQPCCFCQIASYSGDAVVRGHQVRALTLGSSENTELTPCVPIGRLLTSSFALCKGGPVVSLREKKSQFQAYPVTALLLPSLPCVCQSICGVDSR